MRSLHVGEVRYLCREILFDLCMGADRPRKPHAACGDLQRKAGGSQIMDQGATFESYSRVLSNIVLDEPRSIG